MKVLHIGQLIGGLDIYIRNTIIFASGDIDYIIMRGRNDNSKPICSNRHPVKEYLTDLQRDLSLLKDLKTLYQAIRIIYKEKPDLIHCHSAKGGVVGRIAGFLTNTKTFYTPHAFSFLSTQSSVKKGVYIFIERVTKLDAFLLACSESERMMGVDIIRYNDEKALVWNNAVPDAVNELENNGIR